MVMDISGDYESDIKRRDEAEIESELQKDDDEELIRLIEKQNERILFCFKKRISKSLHERVMDRLNDHTANQRV